jgi:hypothetical protein
MEGWCSLEGWSGGSVSVENQQWTADFSSAGGLMVLQRDKGGVDALRRCRFMEEKQLHGVALVNHYAKV